MFVPRLHRSIPRAVSSAPAAALAVGIVVTASGGWLIASDHGKIREERGAQMQRAVLDEKIVSARQRIEQLEVALPPEQARALRAEKLAGELKGLTNTWSWLGGNREQERLNRERLANVEAMHVEAAAKATALQQELQRLRREVETLQLEREKVAVKVRAEEERQASAWYRARGMWLAVRGWIAVAAGVNLTGAVVVQASARRWWSRRAAAV